MNWSIVGIAGTCVILLLVYGGSATAQGHDVLQEWVNYAHILENQLQSLSQENEFLRNELEFSERELARQIGYTNPVINGLIDGEITYYINPLPNYSTYDVSNFDDYLDGQFTGIQLNRVYDEHEADFSILWVKDYGPEYLGVAYAGTTATIGLGSSDCGEWQHFDDWTVTQTVWHEIGHVLGYDHSTDINNIMHSEAGYTRHNYDIVYDEVIPSEWYTTMKFCKGGNQYFEFETSDENDGFEIVVLAPNTDPDDFLNYGTGRYYSDCGEFGEIWQAYGTDCNVPADAQILISNVEDHPIEITGYIQDQNEHPEIEMGWDDDAYIYDQAYLEYVHALFGY